MSHLGMHESLTEWCCCMVLLHGAAACCRCILPLHSACRCMLPLHAAAAAIAAAAAACSVQWQQQQQQFFNIWNRGGRRSGACDIWQISGNPVAIATGGRWCVSGGTLGTILAIKRSFAQANYHLLRRYRNPMGRYRNPVRCHHLPSATIYAALIFNWVEFISNKVDVMTHDCIFHLMKLKIKSTQDKYLS